jgi:hypothetical protein
MTKNTASVSSLANIGLGLRHLQGSQAQLIRLLCRWRRNESFITLTTGVGVINVSSSMTKARAENHCKVIQSDRLRSYNIRLAGKNLSGRSAPAVYSSIIDKKVL